MLRRQSIRPLAPSVRSPRITPALLIAIVVAQLIDLVAVAVAGGSLGGQLRQLDLLPAIVGTAVVGGLGLRLARREADVSCLRWSQRIATMVAVLLGGLLAQELTAVVLEGGGHGSGWDGMLLHAVQTVLPVALLAGIAVAVVVGVARVVRRSGRRTASLRIVWLTPKAPLRRRSSRPFAAPTGPLLARHLAGRAPPLPAV